MDIKDFLKSKKLHLSARVEFLAERTTRYLVNASVSYGVQLDPNSILFIMDDTVFGSGKDGCIIFTEGIAFKGMLQSPIYFSFDKINNIRTSEKTIIINEDIHVHKFIILEDHDIETVFGAIQEWLEIKNNVTINLKEYGHKIQSIKEHLRSLIIPLIKNMVETGTSKTGISKTEISKIQEMMTTEIYVCIEDITKLEESINQSTIKLSEALYIDNLIKLLDAFDNALNDDTDGFDHRINFVNNFNETMLKIDSYNRASGKFLNDLFRTAIAEFKSQLTRENMRRRIDNF